MVNKEFKDFSFRKLFTELCILAPEPSKSDFPVVVHFIGDPLNREYFIKDVCCLDSDSKEILIRVGI